MFRFELKQRVTFGPTQQTVVIAARQERTDGSHKYLVHVEVEGAPEWLVDEASLEPINPPAAA